MEDSFKVRVDRAFGSLEASSSSSSPIKATSSSSSLWCLTDQEIERNEWIQLHKEKHPKPPSSPSSFFHPDLKSDIQQPLEDKSNDEWNVIRSSLGMDCTLDNEEEEDAFDKVALGKEEEEEERFYMRDVNVNDYEVEIDSNNELPNSFTEAFRDPRANLMAAKLRLKQDDESIQKEEDSVVVPDYVRNPSKYTHYTFDSMDDVDEESNKKAYMELLNSVKVKGGNGDNKSMDDDDVSSTSIVFTPRNKSSDNGSINRNKVNQQKKKGVPMISIAAEAEAEAEEVCVMEEDEPEIAASNKTTSGRKYRTKNVE